MAGLSTHSAKSKEGDGGASAGERTGKEREMPLDQRAFRADQGADIKQLRESVRLRGRDTKIVDEIIRLDGLWREAVSKEGKARAERNAYSKEIGIRVKRKENFSQLKEKISKLKSVISTLEVTTQQLAVKLSEAIHTVGNILHNSVTESKDGKDELIREWGKFEQPAGLIGETIPHHHLLEMIDGYDSRRGVKVAGTRGYFLKGYGMLLNHALQTYGVQFLVKKGYVPIQPPVLVQKHMMEKVAQLGTFEEDLYSVDRAGNTKYAFLAATSEQPLVGMHAGERIPEPELPLMYCGLSTCFRKELTSHGVDSHGLFRVHQFEKVEQFVISSPSQSWKLHEYMLGVSEEFYKSLGIPYRVVSVAPQSLNDAAAKKYDLEGWFPSQKKCRELVSCTNCTDYLSRAVETRFGFPRMGLAHTSKQSQYVHMLNSTLCATQRTLSCLLEVCQTPTGIRVPKPLIQLVGTDFIDFVKPRPCKQDCTAKIGTANKERKQKR